MTTDRTPSAAAMEKARELVSSFAQDFTRLETAIALALDEFALSVGQSAASPEMQALEARTEAVELTLEIERGIHVEAQRQLAELRNSYNGELAEIEEKYQRQLQEALDRERGQWVRVEDGLPELEDHCDVKESALLLCHAATGTPFVGYMDKAGNWRAYWGNTARASPTHWRPLPQPPKEGK